MKLSVRGPTLSWLILSAWLGIVGLMSGCSTDSEDDYEFDEPMDMEEEMDEDSNEFADTNEDGNLYANNYAEEPFSNSEEGEPDNLAVGENNYSNNNEESNLLGNNYENNYSPAVGEGDDLGYQNNAEYGDNTEGEYDDDGQFVNEGYNSGDEALNSQNYAGSGENYENMINSQVTATEREGEMLPQNYPAQDYPAGTGEMAYDGGSENLYAADGGVENPMAMADSGEEYLSSDAAPMMLGGGLPELGSKMHYIVQKGDTLASIAEKIYGNRDQWRVIQQLTGMENPHMIYPGDVVYYQLSQESEAFASAYENTPKGEVTVGSGDTLSSIASRVYGDSSQWQSLWRANDTIDNPDKLEVGQTVYFVDSSRVMAEKKRIEAMTLAQVKDKENSDQLTLLIKDTSSEDIRIEKTYLYGFETMSENSVFEFCAVS